MTIVSYNGTVKDILDMSCVGCHRPGALSPDFSTYSGAVAGAARALVRITANTMPPGSPLALTVQASFSAWVKGGTPLDGVAELPVVAVPPVEPTPMSVQPADAGQVDSSVVGAPQAAPEVIVSYNGTIKGLLADHCIGCHSPGRTSPDLTTYDGATAASAAAEAAIENGRMPMGSTLSDALKVAFKKWVDGGMPLDGVGETPISSSVTDAGKCLTSLPVYNGK